jgi:hypothetical protein
MYQAKKEGRHCIRGAPAPQQRSAIAQEA